MHLDRRLKNHGRDLKIVPRAFAPTFVFRLGSRRFHLKLQRKRPQRKGGFYDEAERSEKRGADTWKEPKFSKADFSKSRNIYIYIFFLVEVGKNDDRRDVQKMWSCYWGETGNKKKPATTKHAQMKEAATLHNTVETIRMLIHVFKVTGLCLWIKKNTPTVKWIN